MHPSSFQTFASDNLERVLQSVNQGLQKTCIQMRWLGGSVYESEIKGPVVVTWDDDDPVPQLKEVSGPDMLTDRELEENGFPSYNFHHGQGPVSFNGEPSIRTVPLLAVGFTDIRGGFIVTTCIHHNVSLRRTTPLMSATSKTFTLFQERLEALRDIRLAEPILAIWPSPDVSRSGLLR